MELRHLESFCVIASEMHITRAAERLHIAQPALTQQLRLLEKELGFPLVRRAGRGIVLTEAGEFFHQEAALILQHLSRAVEQTREIARGETSHLRVGVTEAVAYSSTLAKILSCFQERWPAVRVTLSQKAAIELGPALREHQIDAAFTCPIHTASLDLSSHRLAQDRMILAVPARHPLAGRKSVSLPDLRDEPLVLVTHDRVAGTDQAVPAGRAGAPAGAARPPVGAAVQPGGVEADRIRPVDCRSAARHDIMRQPRIAAGTTL